MVNCQLKKSYSVIQNLLSKNNLTKDKIINTKIFDYLTKNGFQLKKNMWISNITSMCMKSDPKRVRIRCDQFLKKIKLGEKKLVIISGIHIKGVDLIILFFGNSFYGYNFKTNSSNSFINFNFDDFEKFSLIRDDYELKNVATKNGNEKTKYMFYTSPIKHFDKNNFLNFYEKINVIGFDPYKNVCLDKNVSKRTKEHVMNLYNNCCAIAYTDREKCSRSSWASFEKIEELAKNSKHCLEIDIHHFIPKKWFKNQPGIVNWDIVNDSLNLIPVCSSCHKSIHSNNEIEVSQMFENIICSFKKVNVYNKFIEYSLKYTKLDLHQIKNLYMKSGS